MRVVCGNCNSVYKIPDDKLVKPINKATCRSCNARLLIPKPSRGADPDARTVVTAIPASDGGGLSDFVDADEDSEKTMPAIDFMGKRGFEEDVPLLAGAPFHEEQPTRAGPAAVTAAMAAATAARPPGAAPTTLSLGLGYAFTGALLAAIGTLIIPFAGHPVAMGAGIFLATCGAFTTMLVIATSNFGRRSAQPVISTGVAVLLGLLVALTVVAIQTLLDQSPAFPEVTTIAAAPKAPELPPAPEAEADEPAEEAPAEDPAPTAAAAKAPAPAPAAAPRAAPAPAPARTTTSSSSGSRSSTTTAPARTSSSGTASPTASTSTSGSRSSSTTSSASRITPEEPAPAPVTTSAPPPTPPTPAPSQADNAVSAIPMEVIDIQLRNNIEVKKCFFAVKQAEGRLPARVDITFSLSASGRASGLTVKQDEYRGSSLERCLGSAVGTISFPPSQGGSQTVKYPFILQ